MMRYEFSTLVIGAHVRIAASDDVRTARELTALQELVGDDVYASLLDGDWIFVERRTAEGKSYRSGAFALVRARGDSRIELVIHHRDLRHPPEETPARRLTIVPSSAPARVVASATPQVSDAGAALAFKPDVAPWAHNIRVGALYVDVDPDGAVCCAVVRGRPGKAVITLRAGSIEDFEALGPAITRHLVDLLRKKLATP